MLKGWLANGLGPVVAVETNPSPSLKTLGVRIVSDIPREKVRACVIALKPQVLRNASARRSRPSPTPARR